MAAQLTVSRDGSSAASQSTSAPPHATPHGASRPFGSSFSVHAASDKMSVVGQAKASIPFIADGPPPKPARRTSPSPTRTVKAPAVNPAKMECKVDVGILRTELERFASKRLQTEFGNLADRLEGVIRKEFDKRFDECSRFSSKLAPVAENASLATQCGHYLPLHSLSMLPNKTGYASACSSARSSLVMPCRSQGSLEDAIDTMLHRRTSQYRRLSKAAKERRRASFDIDDPSMKLSTRNISPRALMAVDEEQWSGPPTLVPPKPTRVHLLVDESEDGDDTEVASKNSDGFVLLKTLRSTKGLDDQPQSYFSRAVQSEYFDYFFGFLIIINSVSIGVQADYKARQWTQEVPFILYIGDHVFNWAFSIELLMRYFAYGSTFWGYAKRNPLDCAVIMMGLVDELAVIFGFLTHHNVLSETARTHIRGIAVLRIARVFRLVRIIRIPAVVKHLAELRVMLASVLDSLQALMWTLVLILVITYTFGVYLTQLVTNYKLENEEQLDTEHGEAMLEYFGSVDRTVTVLYEAVLDGVHWRELVNPIWHCVSAFDALLIAAYMTFCILALMNVVTAIVVTSALKNAEDESRALLAQQMRVFFAEADDDGSGSISLNEFQDHLTNPTFKKFLREIDLDPEHAQALFTILDEDGGGDVSIEELVSNCLRLHGNAKAIDLLSYIRASEREWQEAKAHRDWMHMWCDGFGEKWGLQRISTPEIAKPVVTVCKDVPKERQGLFDGQEE